ncbi:MAG TPA: MBL fold metallo-hydrolase [bacterium]|nr:MBL fold metallo-hydrolase [bacterium]
MILETLVVGPLAVNCFVLGCQETQFAAIIDPGDEAVQIIAVVDKLGVEVKYILLTHGHVDHIAATSVLLQRFNAELVMHRADEFLISRAAEQAAMFGLPDPGKLQPNRFVEDGDTLLLGKLPIQVLHTPGHSPGNISLLVGKKVFVGDLIFYGSIGRTDLPGGDFDKLIHSVNTKIFSLPDSTEIYPGHGPDTTVGFEKQNNPFFR